MNSAPPYPPPPPPPPQYQQQQQQQQQIYAQQQQQEQYNIAPRGTSMYPPQAQPQSIRGGGGGGMGYHRPPFVDPDTNIVYDTSNAEYEGWLTKQSAWLKVCVSSIFLICQ